MKNATILQRMNLLWGLYFYIPIFALYFSDNGVSISAVIFAQVLYSVFLFLWEIPTGIVADRFGQKNSVIVGYFLELVWVSLLLFFPTTIGLYISYSLRWLAGSCISGSEEALWYESCKIEHISYKKFSSNCTALELLGYTIATATAWIVLQYYGSSSYERLIGGTVIALLIVFVLSIFLKSYRESVELPLSPKQLIRQTILLFQSNDTIRTLLFVSLLTLNGQYFLEAVYPLQFQSVVLEPLRTGLALTIGGLVNIGVSKYMYILEEYLTYEKILLLVHVAMGIGYLMIWLPYSVLVLIWFIMTCGLFNSHNSVTSDYINQEIEPAIRATTLSSLSFVRTGGQIIARLLLWICVWWFWVSWSLYVQWWYLLVWIGISYWLLVRCGCVNKVHRTTQS